MLDEYGILLYNAVTLACVTILAFNILVVPIQNKS